MMGQHILLLDLIQDDAKWSTNSNVSFWRYVAVFVSWFSILVTLVIGILEFGKL